MLHVRWQAAAKVHTKRKAEAARAAAVTDEVAQWAKRATAIEEHAEARAMQRAEESDEESWQRRFGVHGPCKPVSCMLKSAWLHGIACVSCMLKPDRHAWLCVSAYGPDKNGIGSARLLCSLSMRPLRESAKICCPKRPAAFTAEGAMNVPLDDGWDWARLLHPRGALPASSKHLIRKLRSCKLPFYAVPLYRSRPATAA